MAFLNIDVGIHCYQGPQPLEKDDTVGLGGRLDMKKYKITRFYRGIYVLGSVSFIPPLIISIDVMRREGVFFGGVFVVVICLLGLITMLYPCLFDFQWGALWTD